MSEGHGAKRRAPSVSPSKNVKVAKLSDDDRPSSSPGKDQGNATLSQHRRSHVRSSGKKCNTLVSAPQGSPKKSQKYGNVASVRRRLISPHNSHDSGSHVPRTSPTKKNKIENPQKSRLRVTPPHLQQKYSLRSPSKVTLARRTSPLKSPVQSPLRRPLRTPGKSPHNKGRRLNTPGKSRETSPYKLRSPAGKDVTPGKRKVREDELNLSSDAGIEHLKILTEQLSSLNEDSGGLTTAMYRKCTPEKARRTPGKGKNNEKNRTPKSKTKTPPAATASTSTASISTCTSKKVMPPPEKTDDDDAMWIDCESDNSSELNILEPDLDLEAALDHQAEKNKLSAVNVKNILHHVITNEHVVAMVRSKVLEEDPTDESFQPKMTRAKVKEYMETGKIPQPWPISPIKKQEKEKTTTIMELTFSDDEDDEYDPHKEPPCDSDDSESFISAPTSDYGSPRPATPTTPKTWPPRLKGEGTPKTGSPTPTQVVSSPVGLMGPPLPPTWKPSLSNLRSRLNDVPSAEEEETIATRTRSKLPLTDTPLDEIESNFVAPDITPDLYDTQCDDKEWGSFLSNLMKTEDQDLNDTQDDEQNDPEYNFLAEEEYDDEDEMRDDRAVKVTKKELNILLDELFEAYGGADILDDSEGEDGGEARSYNVPSPMKLSETQKTAVMVEVEQEERKKDILDKLPDELPVITPDERLQLEDQMRKHTQLLLQVGVLSMGTPGLEGAANTCKFLLNEFQRFANLSRAGDKSAFRSDHLDSANQLIQTYTVPEREDAPPSPESPVDPPKKCSFKSKALHNHQKRWFAMCEVCVYPRLLPLGRFHPPDMLSERASFSEAEDRLLALAMAQFQHTQCHIKLINLFVMPVKTRGQIRAHIKNRCMKKSPDNIIKQVRMTKICPSFPKEVDEYDPANPKLPIDHPKEVLPPWVEKLKDLRHFKTLMKQHLKARRKREGVKRRQKTLEKKLEREKDKLRNMSVKDLLKVKQKQEQQQQQQPGGVETRHMSMRKTFKSTVMAKVTTRGERKKLSKTFGTNYDEIDFTQEVSNDNSDEDNEDSDDSESSDSEGSEDSESSGSTSDDSQSEMDSSENSSVSYLTNSNSNPSEQNDNSSRVMSDVQPLQLNLPLLTVHVIPQGPALAAEAEVSTENAVVQNPIPEAVEPAHGYMEAHDANPVVPPVVQAVMPAAEAAQPVVPQAAVPSSSNVLHRTPKAKTSSNSSQSSPLVHVATPGTPGSRVSHDPGTPGSHVSRNTLTPSSHVSQGSCTPGTPCTPASVSSVTSSPSNTQSTATTASQGFTTPNKRYKPLAPKAASKEPEKKVSPFIEKEGLKYRGHVNPKIKRRLVNRPIQPKGIIIKAYISPTKSPTKKAADSIKARLRKKPRPILPKPMPIELEPVHDFVHDEDYGSDEDEAERSSPVADENSDYLESDNEDNPPDSQGEEDGDNDHLAELMAASTTISAAKRPRKNPGVEKRALTDAVLTSNIVESDPLREDRDTAFARNYLTRVKQAMKNDGECFEKFVQILSEFGQSEKSSTQLYPEVCELLKPYPDLIPDFATFLSPGEALECGCSIDALEFHRARSFLRRLEVHFQKHPNFFQKIVKALDTCRNGDMEKVNDLKQLMKTLLKGQPHLLDEFMQFFPDEKPPISQMTDFEEITLDYSDEEPSSYELMKLPEDKMNYGTSRCSCTCHGASGKPGAKSRKKHCRKCALTIIDGQPYLFTKDRLQGGPVMVVVHKEEEEDSRQSVHSRRESLDSIGQGLSDIENMEEGAAEPHRKRPPGAHKVLAELTDSSDQASNDAGDPAFYQNYSLNNVVRNQVQNDDDEEDVDDVEDDDLDDDEEEGELVDDEDDNNEDDEDNNENEDDEDNNEDDDDNDVEKDKDDDNVIDDDDADDLDDLDESDDNEENLEVNGDSDDDDDDFDPAAYIEEEENEETQSTGESPASAKGSLSRRLSVCSDNVEGESPESSKDALKGTFSMKLENSESGADCVDGAIMNKNAVGDKGLDSEQKPGQVTVGKAVGTDVNVVSVSGGIEIARPTKAAEKATKAAKTSSSRASKTGTRQPSGGKSGATSESTADGQKSNITWSKEEDSIILELCKQHGPTIRTFKHIATRLKNRSGEEISMRFDKLLDMMSTGVAIR